MILLTVCNVVAESSASSWRVAGVKFVGSGATLSSVRATRCSTGCVDTS
jgi:hypothetical protein